MLLTIKSNFTIFKERQGQEYKAEELENIFKALIKEDIINFKGNISYGYTRPIANKILTKLNTRQINKDGIIVIINDLTLQMFYTLLEDGYKRENIYLAYGKWYYNNNKARPSVNKISYNIMKEAIKHNIEETINVITLEELFDMGIKIDAIIANPPYGAIGANITNYIRQNIDYDLYVNLLPANDYKRNKTKDLFNYQSEMEAINAGDNFNDAYVTTHLCLVNKNKVNNMALDEFERSQYVDPSLDKYFAENNRRKHYAIDDFMYKPSLKAFEDITVEQSIYIGKRDIKSEHLPYSRESIVTKYNTNKITKQEVIDQSAKSEQALGRVGDFYLIKFNTEAEKNNFAAFMYSEIGFKFLCKIFIALNVDSSINLNKFMPKVDWTRPWTVEEILIDYDYTEAEIKEVMDDLKTNSKYKYLKG